MLLLFMCMLIHNKIFRGLFMFVRKFDKRIIKTLGLWINLDYYLRVNKIKVKAQYLF